MDHSQSNGNIPSPSPRKRKRTPTTPSKSKKPNCTKVLEEDVDENEGMGHFLSPEVKLLLVNYRRAKDSKNPFDSDHQRIIDKLHQVATGPLQRTETGLLKANLAEAALLLDCAMKVYSKQTLSLKKEVMNVADFVTQSFTRPEERPGEEDENDPSGEREIQQKDKNHSQRQHPQTEDNTSNSANDAVIDRTPAPVPVSEPGNENEVELTNPSNPEPKSIEVITIEDDEEDLDEMMEMSTTSISTEAGLNTSQIENDEPSGSETNMNMTTEFESLSLNNESGVNVDDLSMEEPRNSILEDSLSTQNQSAMNSSDAQSDEANANETGISLNQSDGNLSQEQENSGATIDPGPTETPKKERRSRIIYGEAPQLISSLELDCMIGDYVNQDQPPSLSIVSNPLPLQGAKKKSTKSILDQPTGGLVGNDENESPQESALIDGNNEEELIVRNAEEMNVDVPEPDDSTPALSTTNCIDNLLDEFDYSEPNIPLPEPQPSTSTSSSSDPLAPLNITIKTEPIDTGYEIMSQSTYDAIPNPPTTLPEFTEAEQKEIDDIITNLHLLYFTTELSEGEVKKTYDDSFERLEQIYTSHNVPFNRHLMHGGKSSRKSVEESELLCTPYLRPSQPDPNSQPIHEMFFQALSLQSDDPTALRNRLTVKEQTAEKNRKESDIVLTKLLEAMRKQVVPKFAQMPLMVENTEAFFRRVKDFEARMKKVLEEEEKKEEFNVTKYEKAVLEVATKESQEPCEETRSFSIRSSLSVSEDDDGIGREPLDLNFPISPSPSSSEGSETSKWVPFKHLFHHMDNLSRPEIARVFYAILTLLSEKDLDMKYDNHFTEESTKNAELQCKRSKNLEEEMKKGFQILKAQCPDVDVEEIYLSTINSVSRGEIFRQREARNSISSSSSSSNSIPNPTSLPPCSNLDCPTLSCTNSKPNSTAIKPKPKSSIPPSSTVTSSSMDMEQFSQSKKQTVTSGFNMYSHPHPVEQSTTFLCPRPDKNPPAELTGLLAPRNGFMKLKTLTPTPTTPPSPKKYKDKKPPPNFSKTMEF